MTKAMSQKKSEEIHDNDYILAMGMSGLATPFLITYGGILGQIIAMMSDNKTGKRISSTLMLGSYGMVLLSCLSIKSRIISPITAGKMFCLQSFMFGIGAGFLVTNTIRSYASKK